MKRGWWICLIWLGVQCPVWLGAQSISNVNSSISIIGGEPFYKHEVLDGQTIEAIAEAYYTNPQDIAAANPEIIAGIKPGMKLKIPFTDESLAPMSGQPGLASEPERVVKRTEPEPVQQQSTPPPQPRPKPETARVTPMQEAVTLLEEEQPKEEPVTHPEPALEEEEPVNENWPPDDGESEQPIIEEAEVVATSEPETEVEAPKEEPSPVVDEKEVDPVDKESSTEATGEEPELIMDLNQLSDDVQESLESLQKIRQALEAPAELKSEEKVEPVDPKTARFMSDFLDDQMVQYFDSNATDSVFHLREYFFANIDSYGRIGGLKDERTVTNKNTRMLDMSELNGVVLDAYEIPNDEGERVALGIEMDVKRYEYDLKVKRKKVRLYESTMYVEHLASDHPHARLILNKAAEMGERGRCKVALLDGKKSVSMHRPFEYNPFGNKAKSLLERPVLRMEQMDFK